MKTSSCKAKGRRLQDWFAKRVAKLAGVEYGQDGEAAGRTMGESGVDIRLSPALRKRFPFSVECKNQETWSLKKYIQQAKENRIEGTEWLVVLKRNRMTPVVVLDADVFLNMALGGGRDRGADVKNTGAHGKGRKVPVVHRRKKRFRA